MSEKLNNLVVCPCNALDRLSLLMGREHGQTIPLPDERQAALSSHEQGDQRELAVAFAGRGSPIATQTFGSLCDWRFTKW